MRFTFLGSFDVIHGHQRITRFSGDKVRALLAYLAIEADRPHERDALAALLWPQLPATLALRNLTQSLIRLRSALGDTSSAVLHITRQAIQWRAEADVDVTTFERLIRSTQLADLEAAADLYGGELLAGFGLADCDAFEEWLRLRREQAHLHVIQVYERLADQYSQARRYDAAVAAAHRQIALDPWREIAYRQLMRALAALGDRAGALAVYERSRHVLLVDLGTEPDPETTALAAQLRHHQPDAAAEISAASHLPMPLTPIVGREQELAALGALITRGARLVTVLGPGGIGKTCLALAAAHRLRNDFPAGVWWITLVGVRSAGDRTAQYDQLASTILSGIGHQQHGARSLLQTLRDVVRKGKRLLVLDNCEHLPMAGSFIATVLEAAPELHVLATSRERLAVYGEEPFIVSGLAVPSVNDEQAADYAAVQLFLVRARRQLHDLGADLQTLASVVRLCTLLEGMPLGIELAAHWVGEYSPEEIATAVRTDLLFLETRDRHTPHRQRSLQAVFHHSWSLLGDSERRALMQLAICVGGFDRMAALTVSKTGADTLAALVDKSLLVRVGAGRYRMHELLRQFALTHLDQTPALRASVEGYHSTYYLALVADRAHQLMYDAPREAAAEIEAEIDNVRQAWAWAVGHTRINEMSSSANGMYQFYAVVGYLAEREQAFALACQAMRTYVQQVADDAFARRTLGLLLALHATGLARRGHNAQTIHVAREVLELGPWSAEGSIIAHYAWGRALADTGQLRDARAQIEHTLGLIADYTPDQLASGAVGVIEWASYLCLGVINTNLSNYHQAHHDILRVLQICQAHHAHLGEIDALYNLANLAHIMVDLPTARAHYEHALQRAPHRSSRSSEGRIKLGLGEVVRLQGEYTQARDLIERALEVFRAIGDTAQECIATAALGRLAIYMGDDTRATQWFARFTALSERIDVAELPMMALRALYVYAHHMGDAAQALAYAEQYDARARAYSHTYDQACALVLLGHARAHLGVVGAVAAYQQALDRYAALPNPALAADALAGLATVMLAQNRVTEAYTYVELLLQCINDGLRVGLDEPFDVYVICYQVLCATNDQRATQVLQTTQAAWRRWAAGITDLAERQRFLARRPSRYAMHMVSNAYATKGGLELIRFHGH